MFDPSAFDDRHGTLHGYCTYVEGEITSRWYRSRVERDLAVSEEACGYWASGRASAPPGLQGRNPRDFYLVDGLCDPHLPATEATTPLRGSWSAQPKSWLPPRTSEVPGAAGNGQFLELDARLPAKTLPCSAGRSRMRFPTRILVGPGVAVCSLWKKMSSAAGHRDVDYRFCRVASPSGFLRCLWRVS